MTESRACTEAPMLTGIDQTKMAHGSAEDAIPSPIDRYVRQTRLPEIGSTGQLRLEATSVLVIGCGALGCVVADLLTRAGFGTISIADRDYVELHNLQRQSLFDETDVSGHLPKAEAAGRRLRRVNSTIAIEPIVTDIDATNVLAYMEPADIVIDGTDNFETRYLINDAAIKLGKPWIYGGVLASYGTTMTIVPGITPCLRCIFPRSPEAGTAPTCDTAGVLGPAVAVIAAIEAAEAVKLAVGDLDAINRVPLTIDLWSLAFHRLHAAERDPECVACGQRSFPLLDRPQPPQTLVLCGHDAVQVRPETTGALDLARLGERLAPLGDVLANEHLLRVRLDGGARELTIFRDGRAIVKGTEDPVEARSLYARYVGI